MFENFTSSWKYINASVIGILQNKVFLMYTYMHIKNSEKKVTA